MATQHPTAAVRPPPELTVKVAFLLRQAFAEPPEAIETNLSWVFLTEDRAYKLKKPVERPFLDHRRVEDRRRACEAEVELNQALAPGVYLGVVPLTCSPDDELALEGDGSVIDWLVVMRRLPTESFLDQRLRTDPGSVSADEVDRVVAHLTAFYRTTAQVPLTPVAYRRALLDVLEIDRAELRRHNHAVDVDAISDLTDRLGHLVRTYPELDGRAARVVEGHGDLRPEHVLLDSGPLVIDRITFDRKLRLVDPVGDLALLAVECDFLGAPAVGDQIIAAYLARADDPASAAIISLHHSLRATTRARLSIAHLAHSDRDAGLWLDRTDAYLAIARNQLERHLAERSRPGAASEAGSRLEVQQVAERAPALDAGHRLGQERPDPQHDQAVADDLGP